jgi:hypothetical protein
VGFEPTTRFSLSTGAYEHLLRTQKLPCLSTEDAHYLLLSIVFAVSFAVWADSLKIENLQAPEIEAGMSILTALEWFEPVDVTFGPPRFSIVRESLAWIAP